MVRELVIPYRCPQKFSISGIPFLPLYREFCKIRNAVQRDIKLAKEQHFKHGVEKNKGDSGKLWGHLKSLGHGKDVSSSRIVLDDGGTKVHDSSRVAHLFNSFYCLVASDLVAKLPSPHGIYVTTSNVFRTFYRKKLGLRPGFWSLH